MNQAGRRTRAIGLAVAAAVGATAVVLATTGGDDEPAAPPVAAPSKGPPAPRVLPPTNVEPPRVAPSPAPPVPAPPRYMRDPDRADAGRDRALAHQQAERHVTELLGTGPRGDASGSLGGPGTVDSPPAPRGATGDGTGLDHPATGGTGSGPPKRNRPTATYGQPVVRGELDAAQVRRYVRRFADRIELCYERRLVDVPSLEGTARVELRITSTGLVDSASASGLDAETDACIADVFRSIRFPAPTAGTVDVRYAITFGGGPK